MSKGDNVVKKAVNNSNSTSWTDNGNNMSQAYVLEQHRLQSIINDRASTIHRIDEDIEKLELAIQDANRAIDSFKKSSEDMQLIEAEVKLIFKGESASAFLNKISAYKNYCSRRAEHMETLKSNYSKQISQLKYQKVLAQNMIFSLKEHIEKIRRSCFR